MSLSHEVAEGNAQAVGKQQKLEDQESDLSTDVGSEGSDCEGAGSEDDSAAMEGALHFSAEETLLILDWDDTLFPTSWIEAQCLRLGDDCSPTADQRAMLDIMAERAAHTLRVAKSYGSVVIVTNAEHGWIEMSCQKFMPSLRESLEGVKILSARSRFERQGVGQPSVWKLLAFRGEIDLFFGGDNMGDFAGGTRCNIISVGDSLHEREALIRVTDRFPNSWAKSLKLMEKPGAEEFLTEHEVICSCLGDIVNHEGNLDVSICSP